MGSEGNVEEVTVGGIGVAVMKNLRAGVDAVIGARGAVRSGWGVAINPEKVMRAQADPELKRIINHSTFRFADGIGVVCSMRRKGAKLTRIAGCDLWLALMERAAQEGIPVFLVGGKPATLAMTREKLMSRFPGIIIAGSRDGYFGDIEKESVFAEIRAAAPKIVTVAMGSPKQERFIEECRNGFPSAFYLGVGGTYDVFTGTVKRAPRWAQALGLEWLYRLAKQPSRAGRQTVLLRYLWMEVAGKL